MRAKPFAAIADAAAGTFDLSLVDGGAKNAIYDVSRDEAAAEAVAR